MNTTGRSDTGVTALLLGGAAAITLGALWDISWDSSIGEHSFWSPPHVTVNLGGLAIGAAGLRLLGRRLVAAALALAGCAAMAAAEAVGLFRGAPPIIADAWTPLQLVAVGGMLAAVAAAVAHAAQRPQSSPLAAALAAGMLLTLAATALGAYSLPNLQRTALFHQVSGAAYPGILMVAAAASRWRWAATAAALVYSFTVAGLVWVLPLFAATPAAATVFHNVDSMLPPRFPLLLVVPAFAIDVCRHLLGGRPWLLAPLVAVAFCATFVPLQWYFAAFLLSPASANWFFAGGGEHWPFYVEIGAERAMFWGMEQSPLDAAALASVLMAALLSAGAGQLVGRVFARPALRSP